MLRQSLSACVPNAPPDVVHTHLAPIYSKTLELSTTIAIENDDLHQLTARANRSGLDYCDMLLQPIRTGYPCENLIADYDVVQAHGDGL